MTSHLEHSRRRMLLGAATIILSTVVALACGDKSQHASDGDTGAAAPATTRDMSATPQVGDSTAGVAKATGQPGVAGDTMGSRAADSARRSPTTNPRR